MVTLWLAAIAVIGVVGLAQEVIVHAWLAVLAAGGAVTGAYMLGRRHGARRPGIRPARAISHRAEITYGTVGKETPGQDDGSALSRLLADPRSGARPFGDGR